MNTVGPVHATPGGSTSGPATATIPTATLLTTTACHLCEDAHAELARRAARGELTLEVVPLDSAEGRALRDVRAMIERDRNHPSIIAWTLINEDWGTRLIENADHRTGADMDFPADRRCGQGAPFYDSAQANELRCGDIAVCGQLTRMQCNRPCYAP